MPIAPQKWASESLPAGPDADPNDDAPAATALANGGFALVWNRAGLAGALNAIQIRMYDALGTATTSALTIDSNTAVGVFDPDVASLASGNVVVAYRIGAGDLSFGVRDSAGGLVLGPTNLAGSVATESDVALAYHTLDGVQSVLAVWEDSGAEDGAGYAIRGRYILSTGAFSGAEFTLNTQTAGDQLNPDIAANAAGLNAVVWTDMNANAGDIKLRTVANTTGGFQIAEMTVNSVGTAGLQDNASVAVLTTGNIVAAWESGTNVYVRVVSAAGAFLTGETLISTNGSDPQVAATADGGFTLIYRHANLDGSGGTLRMGAYDSSFNISGGFVTANTTTANDQEEPDIAILEDGRHIVAFQDESTGANDDVRYQVMDTRAQTFYGSSGDDTLVGRFTGMTFANDVGVGQDGADTFYGLSGDDYFYAGNGVDTGVGDTGLDVLIGEAGNDVMYGGGDQDYLFGGNDADILYGEAGVDVLNGEAGDDQLFGGDGIDYFYAGAGADTGTGGNDVDILVMEAGNDFIYGEGGNDYAYGGLDNDTIFGGAGTDVILGEAGNDIIDGGTDVDYVFLGTGDDTFVMDTTTPGLNVDVLHEFTPGAGSGDILRLLNTGWNTIAQVNAAMFNTGNGYSILTLDPDTQIWLIGILPGQLVDGDVAFS